MSWTRATEYLIWLLDTRWEPSITGRENPVPKPKFSKDRKARVPEQGIIYTTRGTSTVEPRGVGWTEERVDERVTLDLVTDSGPDHMWGVLLSDGTSERYGGMAGEVKRVLDTARKGDDTYDLVRTFEATELSDQAGAGREYVTIDVMLEQRIINIVTDPNA